MLAIFKYRFLCILRSCAHFQVAFPLAFFHFDNVDGGDNVSYDLYALIIHCACHSK